MSLFINCTIISLLLFAAGRFISHPLIHSATKAAILPQPALEEEVEDEPLAMFDDLGGEGPGSKRGADQPRLVFEISNDDGFQIQADTWEGTVDHRLYNT